MRDTNNRADAQTPLDVHQLGMWLDSIINLIGEYNEFLDQGNISLNASPSFRPLEYDRTIHAPAILKLASEIHKTLRMGTGLTHSHFMNPDNAFYQTLEATDFDSALSCDEKEAFLGELFNIPEKLQKEPPNALETFANSLMQENYPTNLAQGWELIDQYKAAYKAIYRLQPLETAKRDIELDEELKSADLHMLPLIKAFKRALDSLSTIDVSLSTGAETFVLQNVENSNVSPTNDPFTSLCTAIVAFAASKGQISLDIAPSVREGLLDYIGGFTQSTETWSGVADAIEEAVSDYAHDHQIELDVPAILQTNKLALGPHATRDLMQKVIAALPEIEFMKNEIGEEAAKPYDEVTRQLASYAGVEIQENWRYERPASMNNPGAARG